MDDRESRARRIGEAMEGRTVKWLASTVGCALSTAHSYLRGAVPPADVAIRIADALDVDLRWYVTGENLSSQAIKPGPEQVTNVPVLSVDGSVAGEAPYAVQLLRALAEDVSSLRCFIPSGSAMRPTIPDQAEVLLSLTPAKPLDGGVYILRAGGQLIARRIRLGPDGSLSAVCDNPVFRKQDALPVEENAVFGEVVWVGHRP